MYSELTETEAVVFELVHHKRAYRRKFVWVPRVGQHGKSVSVCFQATIAEVGGQGAQRSDIWCSRIDVEQVEVSWRGSSPCSASSPPGACSPQGLVLEATAGCPLNLTIAASSPPYPLTLHTQLLPSCPTCVEGGIQVVACNTSHAGRSCCGNGACDAAETGSNCPEDCVRDELAMTTLSTAELDNEGTTRVNIIWTPSRHTPGRQLLQCIEARSPPYGTALVATRRTPETAPTFCVVINVKRCAYCVAAGATLQSLARHEFKTVDWLRLYNSNPHHPGPDSVLQNGHITLGPVYTSRTGDSLISIAASAKTTVKAILENNPDLLDQESLAPGQEVCLLLCSAATSPQYEFGAQR